MAGGGHRRRWGEGGQPDSDNSGVELDNLNPDRHPVPPLPAVPAAAARRRERAEAWAFGPDAPLAVADDTPEFKAATSVSALQYMVRSTIERGASHRQVVEAAEAAVKTLGNGPELAEELAEELSIIRAATDVNRLRIRLDHELREMDRAAIAGNSPNGSIGIHGLVRRVAITAAINALHPDSDLEKVLRDLYQYFGAIEYSEYRQGLDKIAQLENQGDDVVAGFRDHLEGLRNQVHGSDVAAPLQPGRLSQGAVDAVMALVSGPLKPDFKIVRGGKLTLPGSIVLQPRLLALNHYRLVVTDYGVTCPASMMQSREGIAALAQLYVKTLKKTKPRGNRAVPVEMRPKNMSPRDAAYLVTRLQEEGLPAGVKILLTAEEIAVLRQQLQPAPGEGGEAQPIPDFVEERARPAAPKAAPQPQQQMPGFPGM